MAILSASEKACALRKPETVMQRRWQWRWTQYASATARLDHGDFVEPAEFFERADAAVEIDEVGTAAEEQVLTVVDDFASAGMLVG